LFTVSNSFSSGYCISAGLTGSLKTRAILLNEIDIQYDHQPLLVLNGLFNLLHDLSPDSHCQASSSASQATFTLAFTYNPPAPATPASALLLPELNPLVLRLPDKE
jgi:hypothetical protein